MPTKTKKAKLAIPDEVKAQVEAVVERFNREEMSEYADDDGKCFYLLRFLGSYCYLDRSDWGRVGPIARLTYTGNIKDWRFAIFKWSDEVYSASEIFPGYERLDGSLEGAMRACLEAYPC